jgi:alkaline phosphatase D
MTTHEALPMGVTENFSGIRMKITRRTFVKGAGAAGAGVFLLGATGCEDDGETGFEAPPYEYDGPAGPDDLFQHGVASGDPLSDRVILWTRVTQDQLEAVDVYFEIATDPMMMNLVNAGYAPVADGARDFTAKVDADGLSPSTTYYYRFRAMDKVSPIGRTKTAPAPEDQVDLSRIAICSCSSLSNGYFHAYREMAKQDLDAVLHLGDYIYEYGGGGVRQYEPDREIVTLEDYRTRYSQYRRDPDLQEAHRQHPFIVVWDDHESTNNSWEDGAQNHQPETEGDWQVRKDTAQQVYSEWMPIRDQEDVGKIWRKFQYGNLFDLLMLDTRLFGRDEQVSDEDGRSDPERTILGEQQAVWLDENLSGSTATWKLLGQQVMFGQLWVGDGTPLNNDQWDGYEASRDRVFDTIEANDVDNTVVLTGDIHTSWSMDLSRNPQDSEVYNPETGEGSLGTEFVVTSITSPSLGSLTAFGDLVDQVLSENDPHIKYYELVKKGFAVLDIRPDRLQTDYFYVGDVADPNDEFLEIGQSMRVDEGTHHVVAVDEPAPDRDQPPALAPSSSDGMAGAGVRLTW